jgi:hypothetical protein
MANDAGNGSGLNVDEQQASEHLAIPEVVRQIAEGVERWAPPFLGFLDQVHCALRALAESGWVEAILERFKDIEDALANAEAMGRAGWTMPLKVSFPECIALLQAATSPESADKAFVEFYSQDDREPLKELLASLHQQPKVTEFRGKLEGVAVLLEAQKYAAAVPALLAVFEGVARRCWTNGSWKEKARNEFFELKLQSLEKGSADHIYWVATKAFVDTLYAPNHDPAPKPQILNRHWVMHGRGPADENLADCLRLLQAIHTVASLDEESQPQSA